MRTPIWRIYMALDGHMQYLEKTSVFHGGPVVEEKPDGKTVADKLLRHFDKINEARQKNGD